MPSGGSRPLHHKRSFIEREWGVGWIRSEIILMTVRIGFDRQGFDLAVSGKTNRSVAQHLDISQKTFEVHRFTMMAMVEGRSLPDLIGISLGKA